MTRKPEAQHTPTPNGKIFQDSDGLYAANGEFIASFRDGQGNNFKMATESVREYIIRAVNSYNKDQKTIKALLDAAKEMFSLLGRTPGGRLWPSEAEFNRAYIRWYQRIAQTEAAS